MRGAQVPRGWEEFADRVPESQAAIMAAVLTELDFVVARRDSPTTMGYAIGALPQQLLVLAGQHDPAWAAWRAWCEAPVVFPDDLGDG
ncbi:MAG: hypothetical protein ACYCPK_00950 [Acidimicrobiales bacterium]